MAPGRAAVQAAPPWLRGVAGQGNTRKWGVRVQIKLCGLSEAILGAYRRFGSAPEAFGGVYEDFMIAPECFVAAHRAEFTTNSTVLEVRFGAGADGSMTLAA